MSGEDLYNLWAEGMEHQGIGVDPWEHVDETERAAWEFTAAQLEVR